MRVYHLLSAQSARDDLLRHRLKVATLRDLNDPFELGAIELLDAQFRPQFRAWRNSIGAEYGVLCFSRSWRSPLLWSHYADRHRGLSLGFDVPDGHLRLISYVKERVRLAEGELDRDGPTPAVRERLFCVKFEHWQYEDEVRVIVPLADATREDAHWFVPFSKALQLKEVVVGGESSVSRAELMAWLGAANRNVTIIKARLAYSSFDVRVNKRGLQ
jgi:hypothetical protein